MICKSCGADNIAGMDSCEECGSDLSHLDRPGARGGFSGRLMNDRVGDLLSEAVQAAPETTVAEALTRMREAKVGCVLVVRDGKLVGVFNERHVLTRVLSRDLDPEASTLGEVMTPDPLLLDPEDPPAHAVHRMVAQDRRHLPVVSGTEILGYVSVRNVLHYLRNDVIPFG